jgi:hypothetical protein
MTPEAEKTPQSASAAGLCNRCLTVPWEYLSNQDLDHDLFSLSETADVLKASSCRLCRLFGENITLYRLPIPPLQVKWDVCVDRDGLIHRKVSLTHKRKCLTGSSPSGLFVSLDDAAEIEQSLRAYHTSTMIDFDMIKV